MYLEYTLQKYSQADCAPEMRYLITYDAGRQQNNLYDYLFSCGTRLQSTIVLIVAKKIYASLYCEIKLHVKM